MRILLHDYVGYGFIVQAARELAARGHHVRHLHNASLRFGKGRLQRAPGDPGGLSFAPVTVDGALDRYNVGDRARLELAYARKLASAAIAWQPDVVLSANTPLLVLRLARRPLSKARIPLVNWLQDIHSVAMGGMLARRAGLPGRAANALLRRVEAKLLRSCAGVVPITDDWVLLLEQWGVRPERMAVVPNWAELTSAPPRQNSFAAEHSLEKAVTLLYAGTLGLKHAPQQLAALAEEFLDRTEVRVVVVSEGLGRTWLEEQRRIRRLTNLVLVDYQPYERLPEVLGSADVLLSMLRPEAAAFSVPSKVLTYLVAGRAQLAAVPAGNLAGRTLLEAGAGLLVEPDRPADWLAAARLLVDDADLRHRLGNSGRAYAEQHFQVAGPVDSIERVLARAASSGAP